MKRTVMVDGYSCTRKTIIVRPSATVLVQEMLCCVTRQPLHDDMCFSRHTSDNTFNISFDLGISEIIWSFNKKKRRNIARNFVWHTLCRQTCQLRSHSQWGNCSLLPERCPLLRGISCGWSNYTSTQRWTIFHDLRWTTQCSCDCISAPDYLCILSMRVTLGQRCQSAGWVHDILVRLIWGRHYVFLPVFAGRLPGLHVFSRREASSSSQPFCAAVEWKLFFRIPFQASQSGSLRLDDRGRFSWQQFPMERPPET